MKVGPLLEQLKFNAEFKYHHVPVEHIAVKYDRNMIRFTFKDNVDKEDRSFGTITDLDETKYNAVKI